MVRRQLRARGIVDETLLEVMAQLPREVFLPSGERAHAYEDQAVGIGDGQTISQPYIVAFMTEKLGVEPQHRVLEVGTGSGYQTAILARLAKDVLSVERIRRLRENAEANLRKLGIGNVAFRDGDGSAGVAESAPYDRILVTAGAPHVPRPLLDQLADGGRLVIPVGGKRAQTVSIVVRSGARFVESPMLPCRFVKLIGRDAWTPE
jgi:protein-L-isoaspartate(D-aspartate) O-methyltransferase